MARCGILIASVLNFCNPKSGTGCDGKKAGLGGLGVAISRLESKTNEVSLVVDAGFENVGVYGVVGLADRMSSTVEKLVLPTL